MKGNLKRRLLAVFLMLTAICLPACGEAEEKISSDDTDAPETAPPTAEELEAKADAEFLASISYPTYEVCEGEFSTVGRWFEKEIDGVLHTVTLNDGAELYFMTNGASSVYINFTVISELELPYFAYSIDGGEFTRRHINEPELILPDTNRHAVRIITDGLTENEAKWEREIGFALRSIETDQGSIKAIQPTNKVIYYFGDSITEGVRALNMNATADGNSASGAYPFTCSEWMDAVTWNVGYGASGITKDGSFRTMSDAIDSLSSTRSTYDTLNEREPDAIVINHGHNDYDVSSDKFRSALFDTLDKLTAIYPDTPVFYAIPFAQYHADDIRYVAESYENITVVETADWALSYAEDNIHPNAAGGKIAGEKLADAMTAVLGAEWLS